jgi:hypothetical protein
MAEALSENVPRPVSVIAVDGAAVDNARTDANRVQVPFRFGRAQLATEITVFMAAAMLAGSSAGSRL